MLVIDEPTWVDVPHEKGAKFALRRLSWTQLKAAAAAEQAEQREIMKSLGGELIGAIMAAGDDPNDEKRQERVRRASVAFQFHESNYGTREILQMGIIEWTGPGYELDFTLDLTSDLDARTAMWAKQAIIDLTMPQDDPEGTELKND